MPAVREALERVRLNRHGACRSEPRTVCQLIPEQPLHALLVDGLADGYPSGDVQSVERLARSVGVRPDVGNLAPASIFILSGLQSLDERGTFGLRGAGICERVELHRSFFRGVSLCREQPSFGSLHSLFELLTASGNRIELDRPQDHCRRSSSILFPDAVRSSKSEWSEPNDGCSRQRLTPRKNDRCSSTRSQMPAPLNPNVPRSSRL